MALAFIADLSSHAALLLVISLVAVCFFEAINGFHDTANAVATVIYTRSLKPTVAVVWSGFMNFLGVFFGGLVMAWLTGLFTGVLASDNSIGVAMGIVNLMPVNEMMVSGLDQTISLVLAVLLAAIIWNLGTWYYGIPCSSSHTLIGSLLGAGFAFSLVQPGAKVNWGKAGEIGTSLLISPFFGFTLAITLMFLLSIWVKNKVIFKEPDPKKAPPFWIRGILIFTCTMVSFFHGSNDGQKGVGLLFVVMMAFLPAQFAFNPDVNPKDLKASVVKIEQVLRKAAGRSSADSSLINGIAGAARTLTVEIDSMDVKNVASMMVVRRDAKKLNTNLKAAIKNEVFRDDTDKTAIKAEMRGLSKSYEFAPMWMIALISICLGVGTMIGWKRIVVTIGEKIGKSHLTYAQGASAEICAAATIAVSTGLSLPVSTTHVLSSGIAGTMVAKGGVKNLQKKTIVNIALAWLLTLPVSFLLAAFLFYVLRVVI
jgi:PiT family inorganic phosphate transporter